MTARALVTALMMLSGLVGGEQDGPDLFPSGVGVDFGDAPATLGVRPIAGDPLRTGVLQGRGYWQTRHIHLDLDSEFVGRLGGAAVVVSVTFHDSGTGGLALHYDAQDDPAAAAPAVSVTGTGQWRSGTFFLDDARLADRLNGADMRLSNTAGDQDITIAAVRVGSVGASVGLGAVPVESGISARAGDDPSGLVTGVRDEQSYWQTNAGTNYFYMNVADTFRYDTRNLVLVSVDYLDEGNGALALHYDSPGDELIDKFKPSEVVNYGNTGTWKTHTFALDDAILTNRSNGSDFRLHTAGSAVPLKVAATRVAVVAAALQPTEGLRNLIAEATRVHRAAREGDRDGQYPAGSKAELLAIIDEARTVADDPAATEAQIKAAAHRLFDELQAFRASAVDTDLTGNGIPTASTGTPGFAFDNDQRTAWTSDAGGDQWLQIDLRQPRLVNDVRVSWGAAYSPDYAVQVSVDGQRFTTVGRAGAPGSRIVRTPFPATTARFVRIAVTGHREIRELEVRRTRAVEPSPRLVRTVFPTEDLVVADFDVTRYGVDSTGRRDATRAIQQALYDCYDAGGGTVWLPAGTYWVTDTLEVHAFCTLRGDRRDPDAGHGDYGTVIRADVAPGNDGPPVFRIGGSAGVVGVTTYYPNQRADAPVPYNYTFEIPGRAWLGEENYMMSTISDVTMLNSYRGIGISTMPSDRGDAPGSGQVHESSTIRNVKGTALFEGVRAYNGADVGTWENVAFSNRYWSTAPGAFHPPRRSTLDTWTRTNGTGFALGDLEWEQLTKLRVEDYRTGIHIVPGQRISFAGSFLDTEIRRTDVALQVDNFDSRWGLVYAGGTLEGTSHAIKNDSQGFVKVTGTAVIGTTAGTVHRMSGGIPAYEERPLPKPTRAVLYKVTDRDAIQRALDRAHEDGGGIVYLPAGWYKVSTHLRVPANVELRGASAVPNRDQLGASGGTVLMAYERTTDTAFITLAGDRAGLRGVRVFYPENNPAGPDGIVPYPYAVRGAGNSTYVINVGMPNAWNGIDMATYRNDGFVVRKLTGAFFDHAVSVGHSRNGRIEGLLSNGNAVTRVGYALPGWAIERDIFPQVIDRYMRPRSKLITVDGARGLVTKNTFAYGFHDGLVVRQGDVRAFNLGTDNLGTGGYTVAVTGGTVTATNVLRYNGTTSTGPVRLVNLMAINMQQASIRVQGEAVSIAGNETEPGRYERGSQVTVISASPDFVAWTEQGQVVSTDRAYTFTVTTDRVLSG